LIIVEKNIAATDFQRLNRPCIRDHSGGFTLLEMSIVLLIMGLLLGSVMQPMGAGINDRKRQHTLGQLVEIREALIGYASVHHRLPKVNAMYHTAMYPQQCLVFPAIMMTAVF